MPTPPLATEQILILLSAAPPRLAVLTDALAPAQLHEGTMQALEATAGGIAALCYTRWIV